MGLPLGCAEIGACLYGQLMYAAASPPCIGSLSACGCPEVAARARSGDLRAVTEPKLLDGRANRVVAVLPLEERWGETERQ